MQTLSHQLSYKPLTNKTSYTTGGKCNTKYTIYAAECTKHRSDVRVKPKACELGQHFSQSKNCKIDNDLRVYILQDNLEDSSRGWNILRIAGSLTWTPKPLME